MFDCGSTAEAGSETDFSHREESIEDIIWHSSLPAVVRSAPLTYVATRVIDTEEIDRLTVKDPNFGSCQLDDERLQKRRAILTKLHGREITCGVIRLPGAAYTIEVDLTRRQIVHIECHRH